MDEKKFLKKLNSKENVKGTFTYTYVCDLLDDFNKLIPNNRSLFDRIFHRKIKDKTPEEIINDNFKEILQKTDGEHLGSLLEKYMCNINLRKPIKDNFEDILIELNSDKIKKLNIEKFFNEFYDNSKEKREFIANNIDKIIRNTSKEYMLKVFTKIKGISYNIDNQLNKRLENNKEEISKGILCENVDKGIAEDNIISEKDYNDYSKTLQIMIEEVLKSENKRWIDIEQIGSGSYSRVYKVGNKIIKIGSPRETYYIPNHPRILQPLIRTNFTTQKYKRDFACVEITDYVNTYFSKNEKCDTDKLYQVYKELRDSNIKWTDVKWSNVGKLIKSNNPTLNKENFEVNPKSIGSNKKVNTEKLGRGDIVIIDTDYIYKEGDSNIFVQPGGFGLEFQERYEQEKKNYINKKENDIKLENVEENAQER
jgi:hypothetical protein